MSKPSTDKPSSAHRELSRDSNHQRQLVTEGSILSGSSSHSQLMKSDMGKKVLYEFKDLQIKYSELQKDHKKLQRKYDNLFAHSNQLKERLDQTVSQERRNCDNILSLTTS